MTNRQHVIIKDIYKDARIPHDIYRPTFVKSLAMMPVRKQSPVAVIGNYWKTSHAATSEEIALLQGLADSTSVALENIQLYSGMQQAIADARASSKALARQLELRDDFISISAHELKTPLTALSLQTQFLQRLLDGEEFKAHPNERALAQCSAVSNRQIGVLTEHIEALIDVSKIRLGQFKLERGSGVNLSKLVLDAVNSLNEDTSQIQIDVGAGLNGNWDERRISQALRILLRNAVRFGRGSEIVVRLSKENSDACISVSDGGIGISEEDQQRIFDRFERVNSIGNYGGLGLGLFIAKRILEEHSGALSVESELGKGSTFQMRLPTS
jgi:signal transduction histidine kinase